MRRKTSPAVDEYIARCAPAARRPLKRIRAIVRAVAPNAEEIISYGIPAFRQHGILIYFAAFKSHIGLYPPIKGNRALEKAASEYTGPKGNLKFRLEEPIPCTLVDRIVRWRVRRSLPTRPARGRSRAPGARRK
jgi:uncharacterized protein YdhG (YjbR/CyaY superfamily)